MFFTRGFTCEILFIADFDWRGGSIVIGYTSVFDEYARNAVGRGCHDIMMIKAQVGRCGCQWCIPILFTALITQSEMPFAKHGRSISRVFEHVSQGILPRLYYHGRVSVGDVRVRTTPGIFTCQQRIA